ncbi:MAG: dihydroxyacetone kinase subunit DhaL [Anaerolineae bacterium]|jgi:dihydroxyacetone kinase-like protein
MSATVTTAQMIDWLQRAAVVLTENKDYLTELDAAIGDADHGANISRGFNAVVEKINGAPPADIGALCKITAMTLMSTVGGASGMLYGNFFLRAAMGVQGKAELTPAELQSLLDTGMNGIIQRGRAEPSDKTMIDAWMPAVAALGVSLDSDGGLAPSLQACADAAEEGMKATIPMQARKGRASYLGERSIGHQDPGATSTYLILQALHDAVAAAQ